MSRYDRRCKQEVDGTYEPALAVLDHLDEAWLEIAEPTGERVPAGRAGVDAFKDIEAADDLAREVIDLLFRLFRIDGDRIHDLLDIGQPVPQWESVERKSLVPARAEGGHKHGQPNLISDLSV